MFNVRSDTDHIRDVIHPYTDFTQIIDYHGFDEIWCRDDAYDREEMSKL